MNRRFDSVLVANRGEIAVRILRSVAAAGYRSIAVYSEADADAPHVGLADEAVLIGPAPAKDSYLDPERILDAAARTGATAIHPGYGFLSENGAFARACKDRGMVFIGPSEQAIELMGNKAAAKRRMLAASVPCVPGYQAENPSDAVLIEASEGIGFPLMVKAAAGGGGRGMRLVESAEALPAALASARSEAENAFGSSELILEKAVLRPRHVEIQVFGDSHGSVIHLGERDCSVQRRHQKVVEEAPCPVLTPALRDAMGAAAVAAAKSIDYEGAGTVEFLLDEQGEEFYFLEMNTRLQVEHPVTEAVTGLDLVDLQLRIAQGGALPLTQNEIRLEGHAIEVRLYAEDTLNDFLPASGTALSWRPPAGEGIRVDHGLAPGLELSPFYDPMIAKIIATGPDRETARRRLLRALECTVLFGVETNRRFLIDALRKDRFIAGEATTAFIAEEFPDGPEARRPDEEILCLAALLQYLESEERSFAARVSGAAPDAGGLAARQFPARFVYEVNDVQHMVALLSQGSDAYQLTVNGNTHDLELVDVVGEGQGEVNGTLRVAVNGLQGSLAYCFTERGMVALQWRGHAFTLRNELAFSAAEREAGGSGAVVAPMHGCVLSLRVAVGDRVAAGDELAVMEAMKMEHRLIAQIDGVIQTVNAIEGQQLSAGAVVMEIAAGEVPVT